MEENKAEINKEKESSGQESAPKNGQAEQKKKKMSKGAIIGLIILLVFVWFMAVQIMAAERYSMQVQVKGEENIMGVNPLGESLDFGDLSRNLGATRFVTLRNDSNRDRYILVWKRGEIADMVKLNKNNFNLKAGEEEKLEFNIQIPPSAESKYYYGKAMVFKWPKLW